VSRKVNIASPSFEYDDDDPEGFRCGMARLGPGLGAQQTGTSVYELPPGQQLCPYHYEYAEEEWLLVVDGRAHVRHPGGVDELGPWDVVCFPPGPDGAHQVRNDGEKTTRVLMWSEVIHPSATVYPDSDKIGIWTGNPDDSVMVRRSSAVPYYDGESNAG
jgi:uncharacterized cupin superfamily protein